MTLHYQVSVILVILSMFHNGGLNTNGSKHYLAVVNLKVSSIFWQSKLKTIGLAVGWSVLGVLGVWVVWCLCDWVDTSPSHKGVGERESHPKVRGAHHFQHGAGKTPRRTRSAQHNTENIRRTQGPTRPTTRPFQAPKHPK